MQDEFEQILGRINKGASTVPPVNTPTGAPKDDDFEGLLSKISSPQPVSQPTASQPRSMNAPPRGSLRGKAAPPNSITFGPATLDQRVARIRKYNPILADDVEEFIKLARSKGYNPTIKSDVRDEWHQRWLDDNGYPTMGNDGFDKLSPHQIASGARAIDWGYRSAPAGLRQLMREYARQKGYVIPASEPWHWTMPKGRVPAASVASQPVQNPIVRPVQPISRQTPAVAPANGIPAPPTVLPDPATYADTAAPILAPTDTRAARGLQEIGNIDVLNRPVVRNRDGSVSTLRSMSIGVDGREVLIPTVSPDGKLMTPQEAVERYRQTGEHLGIFDTPQNATAYARELSKQQAAQYATEPPAQRVAPRRQESVLRASLQRARANRAALQRQFDQARQAAALQAIESQGTTPGQITSIGQLKQSEDQPVRSIGELQRREGRFGVSRRISPAELKRADEAVVQAQSELERFVAAQRGKPVTSQGQLQEIESRGVLERTAKNYQNAQPGVIQAIESPGVLSRIKQTVLDYAPGLASLNTEEGIRTVAAEEALYSAINSATLGATSFKVDPSRFKNKEEAEYAQTLGIGTEFLSALIPYVGAAKAVDIGLKIPRIARAVQAAQKAGVVGKLAVMAGTGAATFGGVGAAREAIRGVKGESEGIGQAAKNIGRDVAIGSVFGAAAPLSRPLRATAVAASTYGIDKLFGAEDSEAAQSAAFNALFAALGGPGRITLPDLLGKTIRFVRGRSAANVRVTGQGLVPVSPEEAKYADVTLVEQADGSFAPANEASPVRNRGLRLPAGPTVERGAEARPEPPPPSAGPVVERTGQSVQVDRLGNEFVPGRTGDARIGNVRVGDKLPSGGAWGGQVLAEQPVLDLPPGERRLAEVMPDGAVIVNVGAEGEMRTELEAQRVAPKVPLPRPVAPPERVQPASAPVVAQSQPSPLPVIERPITRPVIAPERPSVSRAEQMFTPQEGGAIARTEKPVIVEAYRYGDSTGWASKNRDYAEQYAELKGGKPEDVRPVRVELKNPLVVDMPSNEFSSPAAEQKYIKQAQDEGRDGVVFRDRVEGDEFYLSLSPPVHHSTLQPRRARNTATGNKGQFKRGRVKKDIISETLNEPINFGGIVITRADAINQLKSEGWKDLDASNAVMKYRVTAAPLSPPEQVEAVRRAVAEDALPVNTTVESQPIYRRIKESPTPLSDYQQDIQSERGRVIREQPEGLTKGDVRRVARRALTEEDTPLRSAAWHGSPYTFDRFSIDKIGTGEGAQAYGYGLYFAGKKEVAAYYKDVLGKRRVLVDGVPLSEARIHWFAKEQLEFFTVDEAIRHAKEEVDMFRRFGSNSAAEEHQRAVKQLEELKERGAVEIIEPGGALYRVELAPEEDEYLLYDEPISKQSDKVKAALGLGESPLSKGRPNSVARTTQLVRNATESPAFRSQGFSGLDVPTQNLVLEYVSTAAQDPKVLNAIVRLVPVDVVNVLRRQQLTPQMLLHDKAMLHDLLAASSDKDVSGRVHSAASELVTIAARTAAKVVGRVDGRGGSLDKRAASGTLSNRHDVTPISDVVLEGGGAGTPSSSLSIIAYLEAHPNATGKEVYEQIGDLLAESRWGSKTSAIFARHTTGEQVQRDKAASEYLHSLGIRGIKYLDGGSRSSGEGSYNYVIFNDADVEIQEVLRKFSDKVEALTRSTPQEIIRGMKWETEGNQIKLNPESYVVVRGALDAVSMARTGKPFMGFSGVFLTPSQIESLVPGLKTFAKAYGRAGTLAYNLANEIQKASRGRGTAILLTESGARLHEMHHEGSYLAAQLGGDVTLRGRHAYFDELVQSPIYKKVSDALRVDYPNARDGEMVDEVASHIAEALISGDYSTVNISSTEAIEWYNRWHQSLAKKNGDTTEQFREVINASQRIREAVEAARRQRSTPEASRDIAEGRQESPAQVRQRAGREAQRKPEGRPQRQVDSPEFKRWFGQSVVTKSGKVGGEPLVVYHGTTQEFDAFDPDKGHAVKGAIFATNSQNDASRFATAWLRDADLRYSEGARVLPLYLKLENPKIVDFGGRLFDYDVVHGLITQAKAGGYDGVIIRNIRNMPTVKGFHSATPRSTTYVAFSANQIKSAAGNTGEFNPSDPNILRRPIRSGEAGFIRIPSIDSIKRNAVDILNAPRSLMSSFDLSAPLRQGAIFTLTEPKAAMRAARGMLEALVSTGKYNSFGRAIVNDPDFQLSQDAGLYISMIEQAKAKAALAKYKTRVAAAQASGKPIPKKPLSVREESFMSELAGKLPHVKYSEQAYVAYLDLMRYQLFKKYAAELGRAGKNPKNHLKEFQDVAKFINNATGRGDLGETLNSMTPALNALFFSPRYIASRFNLLNPGTYARMSPQARKIAVRKMIEFAGVIASTLFLASLAGADVEWDDPESPDWLKIKLGSTRYDVLAGFQQPMRFIYRVSKGLYNNFTGLENKRGQEPARVTGQFLRSKLSPTASYATDALIGTDFKGDKFEPIGAIGERVFPMMLKDMYEAFQAEGGLGVAKTSPAFFGVGVQTYSPRVEKPRNTRTVRPIRRERRAER